MSHWIWEEMTRNDHLPSPPASTPINRTDLSWMKGWNVLAAKSELASDDGLENTSRIADEPDSVTSTTNASDDGVW